jgi:outer membrane biosynthesis protein TonB
MLKHFGIVAFGLVVVATSSSAFAQQAQRPLTRGIAVQAAPVQVAAKPVAATRAIAVEAAPAAEITAEAKTEAPVVAEEAKPVEAPVVVEKAPVEEKAPVIVKEKAIVKVKPVERFAGYGGYGYSPRYAGGGAHKCH